MLLQHEDSKFTLMCFGAFDFAKLTWNQYDHVSESSTKFMFLKPVWSGFCKKNLLSSLGCGLASEVRHYIQKMWKIDNKNKPHRVSIDFRKAANESLRRWFVLFHWADGYKLVFKSCQPCTVYPTELLHWNWQVCALIWASLKCKDCLY